MKRNIELNVCSKFKNLNELSLHSFETKIYTLSQFVDIPAKINLKFGIKSADMISCTLRPYSKVFLKTTTWIYKIIWDKAVIRSPKLFVNMKLIYPKQGPDWVFNTVAMLQIDKLCFWKERNYVSLKSCIISKLDQSETEFIKLWEDKLWDFKNLQYILFHSDDVEIDTGYEIAKKNDEKV